MGWSISYQDFIEAAADIAEEASKIALSYFGKKRSLETQRKTWPPFTIGRQKNEEAIRAN